MGSSKFESTTKISHSSYSSNVIFDLNIMKGSTYYSYSGLVNSTTNLAMASNSSYRYVKISNTSNMISYNNLQYLPYYGTIANSSSQALQVRSYSSSTFYYQYKGLSYFMSYNNVYFSDIYQTAYERITYNGPYEIVS